MTRPSYGIRPNAPAPSNPGAPPPGGLLVAPRPGTPADGAAPTAASPAAPASPSAAPEGRSPRAGNDGEAAIDPASPPAGDAVLGLPREMSLAELFPAEAAMGAVPGVVLHDGETAAGQASALGADSGSSPKRRMPLVAGIAVTLVILVGGGGFFWWRNRDSKYWQPA